MAAVSDSAPPIPFFNPDADITSANVTYESTYVGDIYHIDPITQRIVDSEGNSGE
jgi:hypothetical protein